MGMYLHSGSGLDEIKNSSHIGSLFSGSSTDTELPVKQSGKLIFLIRCNRLSSTKSARLSVANKKLENENLF